MWVNLVVFPLQTSMVLTSRVNVLMVIRTLFVTRVCMVTRVFPPSSSPAPHQNVRRNPHMQEIEIDHNEDIYSTNNTDLDFPDEDRKFHMLEEKLKVVEGQKIWG